MLLSLAVLLLGTLIAPMALAAPPTGQAPGWYRHQVGSFIVTALYDGYVDLDPALLKGLAPSEVERLLAQRFLTHPGGVQTAVNAFLVDTGQRQVLVDAGAAECFGPTLGQMTRQLEAAGYKTEDVDAVLLTHLHPDHACGLRTAEGKPVFDKATVYVSQDDADFWLNAAVATASPEPMRPFFKMARDAVAPYLVDGRLHRYAAGETLLDGLVDVVPTPGHTPGHASYLFRGGEQGLLVWGDIVHAHAVQFARPAVSIEFDVNKKRAVSTRQTLLAEAARAGWWVAGAHLPFPGIGHVRAEGGAYAWVPVEWGPVREDRPER